MGSFYDFIIDMFKAFAIIAGIGLLTAVLSLIVGFVFEFKNIREEKSNFSTNVGNALLVLHSFLEPGRKPQTEQVIVIKKRRTPVEKKVAGITGVDYYNLYVKGYKHLKDKRYKLLKL
jgi:hypothetical protein